MPERHPLKAIALGVSTGGLDALKRLLGAVPGTFPVPILVVQHLSSEGESTLAALLDAQSPLRVQEAEPDQWPRPGHAYLAPANYHLQVELDGRLSLSTDPLVNFARPSVDVLFETAAAAFGPALAGIILTGAGSDGALGLKAIKQHGGLAIIQDPADAACPAMPRAAMAAVAPDHRVSLKDLPALLARLTDPVAPILNCKEDHVD
jgi:two-component system chemotaxis response regulator CheB